ncbi:hypothetical protein QBC39DRAFT_62518 [Podospora conica]|nr:hypothetical protein QBC39DRAFT_62518 [Schizothecium conicum]
MRACILSQTRGKPCVPLTRHRGTQRGTKVVESRASSLPPLNDTRLLLTPVDACWELVLSLAVAGDRSTPPRCHPHRGHWTHPLIHSPTPTHPPGRLRHTTLPPASCKKGTETRLRDRPTGFCHLAVSALTWDLLCPPLGASAPPRHTHPPCHLPSATAHGAASICSLPLQPRCVRESVPVPPSLRSPLGSRFASLSRRESGKTRKRERERDRGVKTDMPSPSFPPVGQ